MIAQYALTAAWKTAWIWAARRPHNLAATLCVTLTFTAGMITVTLRGARDTTRE